MSDFCHCPKPTLLRGNLGFRVGSIPTALPLMLSIKPSKVNVSCCNRTIRQYVHTISKYYLRLMS